MKILFTIGNLESGGAEKVTATLANNFRDQKHDVAILMISEARSASFYSLKDGVELIPLLSLEKKYSIKEKVTKISQFIESFNPDVVISFLNYVVVYTYFALKHCLNRNKICFVVSERNNPKKVPGSFAYRMLRNHIFNKADGCVFQTNDAKSYFKKVKKSEIIPNPVYLTNKSKRDNANEDIVLVGSDKKEKNRAMAFKAFSLYKKENPLSKLIIIGQKSNKKEMRLIKKLKIEESVDFVGKQKDWHEDYKNSKMFLLTSNYEGMPNALLEACALQIPCISTDCPSGGPNAILENGKRGILVPVKNYKIFAKQMINLSKDNKLCEYYSTINKNLSDMYDEKAISKKWIDFIGTIKKM